MGARTVLAVAAAVLLAHPAAADGLYDPVKSQVVTVVTGSYENVIARSNHTTMLEFYAPWCGHCQNLKPAYEKAATSLVGLAKVAAVNCDDEENKPLCARFEVKGFPTLKILRPGKKAGKPIIEDYNGPRTAQSIVDIMLEKIPNHVRKVKSGDFDTWLNDNRRAKAVLFSDKAAIAPSLKSLAIDFLGVVDVAQIRSNEKALVKKYNIKTFPTLVAWPSFAKDKDPQVYHGEMKKFDMSAFMIRINSPPRPGHDDEKKKKYKKNAFKPEFTVPNPGASLEEEIAKTKAAEASSYHAWLSSAEASKSSAAEAARASASASQPDAAEASSAFSSASKSQASAQAETDAAYQTIETLEDQSQPTESPDPKIIPEDTEVPVDTPDSPADAAEAAPQQIPMLEDEIALQRKCLNTESGTCVLALLPSDLQSAPGAFEAVTSLGRVHQKHETAKRKLFPFFQLQLASPETEKLRKELKLAGEGIEIIAINGKRSWFRRYTKTDFGVAALEDWIDSIRMGDGTKDKVPKGLVVDAAGLPKEPPKVDTSDPVAMAEALRSQLPEGVELELEEIDDNEYQKIMEDAKKNAPKDEAMDGDAPTKEKVDHIIDEL